MMSVFTWVAIVLIILRPNICLLYVKITRTADKPDAAGHSLPPPGGGRATVQGHILRGSQHAQFIFKLARSGAGMTTAYLCVTLGLGRRRVDGMGGRFHISSVSLKTQLSPSRFSFRELSAIRGEICVFLDIFGKHTCNIACLNVIIIR